MMFCQKRETLEKNSQKSLEFFDACGIIDSSEARSPMKLALRGERSGML